MPASAALGRPNAQGVFGQPFGALSSLDIDANGSLAALTDGLLILRHRLGFAGPTLIGGAADPGCKRCTDEATQAYLAVVEN